MKKVALALCATLLVGCGGSASNDAPFMPSHASLFGQVPFSFLVPSAWSTVGQVTDVLVGGIRIVELASETAVGGQTLVSGTLQGAPEPGLVDVEVRGTTGSVVARSAFRYDPPLTPGRNRWMAFGASLTQGTESTGIDPHTQRSGVSGLIARQAGVFLGLPLFVPGLAPPLQPSDLNPDCSQKPGTGANIKRILATVTDPRTHDVKLGLGRLDPTLRARNVAIGGSKIADILHGASGEIVALEHIVEDPELVGLENVLTPETVSQIDRVEALDPDVGFSADLLANDLDSAVLGSDLTPSSITPLTQTQPMLQEIAARLGRLHGQYFLANLPSLTFIPNVARLAVSRVAAGLDTEVSFLAKKKAIDDTNAAYNAALAAAVAPYPNLHLVDFSSAVLTLANGVDVDGEELTTHYYGGLISLDGLHFTDTGYALFANLMIAQINQTLRLALPAVDVFLVHAADALSPTHLRADGLSCVPDSTP